MINDFNKKVAKKIKGLSVREIYRSLKRRIKGQGKDLITLSVYVMQFLKDVANKKHISTNLILTAPSGCGKICRNRPRRRAARSGGRRSRR